MLWSWPLNTNEGSMRSGTKRSFTLLELTIVLVLIGLLCVIIFSTTIIFLNYVNADIERYNIHSQINYALEDMKVRCASAIQIADTSFFSYSGGLPKHRFEFIGEKDIYQVTPDDMTDDVRYVYFNNTEGEVILESSWIENGTLIDREVLVEGKYNATAEFSYATGDEPNFLTVTINATNAKARGGLSKIISKTEGIRLWFVDVVR